MKPLITLLLVTIAVTPAFSQMKSSYYKPATMQGAPRSFVMQLLRNQSTPAAKTTLTKERLIGSRYTWNYFNPALNIFDSSKYIYTGDNGSTFDLNQLQYNFPATQFDYNEPMLDTKGYHVTRPEIMCDTAIGMNLDSTGLILANTTTASYDASGSLLTYRSVSVDTSNLPSLSYYNTYDGSGNVTASIYFKTPNGTSWDSVGKRYFEYNGSGQLVTDSTYARNGTTWYLSTKYIYTYDGSGHITQVKYYFRPNAVASMANTSVYDQTYYSSGNLQSSHISKDTGTGFYLAYVDTFGYASGYNYYNYYTEYAYSPTGWGIVAHSTKHINTAGVPDTCYKSELVYIYDTSGITAVTLSFKDIILYNNHNDPTKYYDYINLGAGYNNNSFQVFYYEPATDVMNTPTPMEVSVYPNPATEMVQVKLNGEMNKNILLQLVNPEGKLLSTISTLWQGQELKMPVACLPAGVYYLSIRDAAGNSMKIEKIVKQ